MRVFRFITAGILGVGVLAGIFFFVTHVQVITATSTAAVSAAFDAATTTAPALATTTVVQPPNSKTYQNAQYHFMLYYPQNLIVSERPQQGGTMVVLFQDEANEQGFEIFIAPYRDSKITQQRFEEDEPSGVLQNPQNITLDGAAATEFISQNSAMGASREVWFLHSGYLYEITTPEPLSDWLIQILQTWKFI